LLRLWVSVGDCVGLRVPVPVRELICERLCVLLKVVICVGEAVLLGVAVPVGLDDSLGDTLDRAACVLPEGLDDGDEENADAEGVA